MVSNVLILHGGWEGHEPSQTAELVAKEFLSGYEVEISTSLDCLTEEYLSRFQLFIPIWTFGELTSEQEEAIAKAVENGMGMVAWHGIASAFLSNRTFKFILGGQFVAHPGDLDKSYRVQFLDNAPLVAGLEDFTITTEQYYLLTDPSIKVIATTQFDGTEMPWIESTVMPVAWTRRWGKGRVFYMAIGHQCDLLLSELSITMLLSRAIRWALQEA